MSVWSPFPVSRAKPGHGEISLELLSSCIPTLRTLSFQYPLKLVAPSPVSVCTQRSVDEGTEELVHTVFLLTYGGGLVAGDRIYLHVHLASRTKLVLLTQGSTKIYKTPDVYLATGQRMVMTLEPGSALCYLPDPTQPFDRSVFSQEQIYSFLPPTGVYPFQASLCVLDWVSEGRRARGESWGLHKFTSRNEIWHRGRDCGQSCSDTSRLLFRDTVSLDSTAARGNSQYLGIRVEDLGVFGTLILGGPLFASLGQYFLSEFRCLPRLGDKHWDSTPEKDASMTLECVLRKERQDQEATDRLLWTASSIRQFVVVKFGAREVEGVKRFLKTMLKAEGTIETEFGERALLCLQ